MQAEPRTFKLLILGETKVGKSSILAMLTEKKFAPNPPPTIGLDFRLFHDRVDGEEVRLQVWDTAGQERFRAIAETFYRQSDAAVVVFDLSDRDSFEKVAYWLESIRGNGNGDCLVCLLGNKSDLAREVGVSLVPQEQIDALAQSAGVQYFAVSAKTNANIYNAFHFLATQLTAQRRQQLLTAAQPMQLSAPKKPRACCA